MGAQTRSWFRGAVKTAFSLAWAALDSLMLGRRVPVQPRTLLIVKTDAIGDYLLFRNYLADIRASEMFRGWRISYLGWSACRDLVLAFDKELIDEFIWLDRVAFMRRPLLRWAVMRDLRRRGFGVVFNPCSQRDLVVMDSLVRASAAPQRIGCGGDSVNRTWLDCRVGDSWYTRLFKLPREAFFEFERNRAMVSQLLDQGLPRVRPQLEVTAPAGKRGKEVLVFPGARHPRRQWPAARLAELIVRMHREHHVRVVLCGGPGDRELAAEVCALAHGAATENRAGQTSMRELAELIAGSCLVVTGDSGPLHLAAALDARLVCLSTANQLFRFTPYPPGLLSRAEFVFPPQVARRWNEPDALRAEFGEYSGLQAAEIPLETVWAAVQRSLRESIPSASESPQDGLTTGA